MKPWHRISLTALLAFILPPLLFPEELFLGQSFYFMDLAWFHYPLRAYIAELWKSGTVPLWNPYSWNGFPLLAESEAGALGLVNAVFLLPIATWQALNTLVLLHVAVAGISAYALVRQVGVSRGASLLASLSYSCGGYIMAQTTNLNIMIGSAWAPLICAWLLRAIEQRRARFAVLSGLVLALQVTSSHPQVPYYTLILLGVFSLYGVLRRWQSERTDLASSLQAIGKLPRGWALILESGFYLALALFVGMGLSAPQWMTGLELLSLSRRSQGLSNQMQLMLSMPPNSFLALIFPRLFVFPMNSWRTTGAFDEFHFYLGLLPLISIVFAVFKRRELIVRFAVVMALVTLALALGRFTPLYAVVVNLPLLSSFRIPARWLFIAAVALLLLVGKGADAFCELLQDESRRPLLKRIGRYLTILFLALSLTVPVALLARPPDTALLQVEDEFSIERIATRAHMVARLPGEAVGFVIVGGISLAAFWLLAWRRRARAFAVAAVAVTFADLFFAGGSLGIAPSFWAGGEPLAQFVKQNDPYARIFSTGAYLDVVPRLGDAQPTGMRVFASSGENDLPLGLQRTEDLLAGVPFVNYLRLTGTKWLVIPKQLPRVVNRHAKIGQATAEQLNRVWETDQIGVYAVPNPLPRAYVVYDVQTAVSKEVALARLADPRFDPSRAAVVEEAPPLPPRVAHPPMPAVFHAYGATSVRVEAEAAGEGLLVLTDVFYPGWRVWVDGVEQPILRANYLFRGVWLKPGRHTVEFRFESPSFQLGLALAGATIALVLGGWGVFLWRKRAQR